MDAGIVRSLAVALVTAVLASPPPVRTQERSAPEFGGRLYRSALGSGADVLASADLDGVAEPLRSRLHRFLTRRSAFRSQYKSEPETMDALRADAKRRAIERSIVALVETPGVEALAAAFVASAPIAGEWNGLHRGPLEEAIHAENTLKKAPGSPLAPWLYVFIAERQRIAFEAYEHGNDLDGMKAAARKYRTFVARARGAEDGIYRAIVDDMERVPYLYLRSANHPRDYDPDT